MKFALVLTMVAAAAAPIAAQNDPTWRQPMDPIRIVGNIYFVGTRGLSSFLIATPEGSIVIDSGEAETVPFIRANVERLGFRMSDVKVLLTGHAHFEHVGGHADLKQMTGAQVMVMDADREALQSGVDRSALGAAGWKPVAVDRVLKDGDTVTLGGRTLTARLTPGHTQGCTTWTTSAVQDGRIYQVAFVCSVTINDGVRLTNNLRVPSIARQYAQSFRVLRALTPDIFVAQHPAVFELESKAGRAAGSAAANPFVDPEGYKRLVDRSEQAYLKQLEREHKH